MASRIFRDDLLLGTRAIVTGGGTGIGRVTAIELACLGADVCLLGRRPEPLLAVRAEIEALGRRALALPTDIRSAEQVGVSVGRVVEEWGGVDLLVNNAGGQFFAPAEEMKLKGFAAVIENNLNGTFQMTQEVARRAMIPQRSGAVVNLLIDMWQGTPGAAHAGAARAAVENLTKSLSMEWARHAIRVNAIAPGTIETPAVAAYPESVALGLRSVVPLGRLGRPHEIAWMIAYLASEAGQWITGETVRIDGGQQNFGAMWNVFQRAAR